MNNCIEQLYLHNMLFNYIFSVKMYTWEELSYRLLRPHDTADDIRRDYRYPLRNIMSGDAEGLIAGTMLTPEMSQETQPEGLEFICVFCYAHPDSDKCSKYRSPAERLVRFRNINYTLMRYNLPQICPGCLKRYVSCFLNVIAM